MAGLQWQRILDSVLAGVIHHLNGRLMGLGGIAHVARQSQDLDVHLLELLEDEIQRIQQFVKGLLALPHGEESPAEWISLLDAVGQAVSANRLRSTTEVVVSSSTERPLVVRAALSPMIKLLLLLILALEDSKRGHRPGITIDLRESADAAVLALSAETGSASALEAGQAALEEARALAVRLGGSVRQGTAEGLLTMTLALPLPLALGQGARQV